MTRARPFWFGWLPYGPGSAAMSTGAEARWIVRSLFRVHRGEHGILLSDLHPELQPLARALFDALEGEPYAVECLRWEPPHIRYALGWPTSGRWHHPLPLP